MKLEVWQRGMDLFDLAFRLAANVSNFKLKSQFTDAAQSTSANIAEGYGRRTLADYLYFLTVAKGSLGESLTRAAGLRRVHLLNDADFDQFDKLHYEVENKLLALIESLEAKRGLGDGSDSIPPRRPGRPSTNQPSNNPPAH